CSGCGCPTTTGSWSSRRTPETWRRSRCGGPTATARRRWPGPGWRSSGARGPAMYKYVLRRLLLAVPVLLLSSLIVFGLMRVMPGDALTALMAESGNVGGEELARLPRGLTHYQPSGE